MAKSHYIEDFRFNVARGLVVNTSVRNIFGTTGGNANIVTGEFRTPWEEASNYTFPSSALTMNVVSSAVGDTAVTILIIGLNADYEIIQETLTLNGTTTVTTTNQYYRINDVITTVGNALGDVTVSNGGTTYAKILAGTGRNQASIYTVPKGHCFLS
jgi:sugar (pentulose or hexulose) kinase